MRTLMEGRMDRLAALDDGRHRSPADRTAAPKGRASVGKGYGLRTLDFPIVPAPHAQTFARVLPLSLEKGTGAVIGTFRLGPPPGRLGRKLPPSLDVSKDRGKAAPGLEIGLKTVGLFFEGLGAVKASHPLPLPQGQLPLHRLEPALTLPLLARVGEAVAIAAHEVGVPPGGRKSLRTRLSQPGH